MILDHLLALLAHWAGRAWNLATIPYSAACDALYRRRRP